MSVHYFIMLKFNLFVKLKQIYTLNMIIPVNVKQLILQQTVMIQMHVKHVFLCTLLINSVHIMGNHSS